jgi:hypothetical protein
MRFNFCTFLFVRLVATFSGQSVEEMETLQQSSFHTETIVRKCINIKSRKTPDLQCRLNAVQGDYCSRHYKHPCRFLGQAILSEKRSTRAEVAAAKRIQAFWRMKAPYYMMFRQGIGRLHRHESRNKTELYSFDAVEAIPALYYFSFVGEDGGLWSFDIRSLGQILSIGNLKQNPYTRQPLSDHIIRKIHSRIAWLRKRKYTILYPTGADLTTEQLWKQKVLDVFMRIDSLGYYVSCDWFHSMSTKDHIDFYKTVYDVWNVRLGLTAAEKERIVPGHANPMKLLFVATPALLESRERSKSWLEKLNLMLIYSFVSRSPDKEQQKLGAMYCIMGLVTVNEDAAEGFPWVVQAIV